MASPGIATGVQVPTRTPLGLDRALVSAARLGRLDSLWVHDHFQAFFPSAIWDKDLSWYAAKSAAHEFFDYQTLLGSFASRAGRMSLGVGVTEPVRRHPVLIAQAMMTLACISKRRPILGIGSGERQNIEPYGLDFGHPVARLEEALQVIRMCFTSQGPMEFEGQHYRLKRAPMDLKAPKGKTPEIWIAAHGPRMLKLTARYGDGWLPASVASPEEYAAKLAVIRAAAEDAGRDPEGITPALFQFAMIAPTEREARAMLDSKVGRLIHLLMPVEVWRDVGAVHPLGENFRGYADIVPELHDRASIEAAIAAVPTGILGRGILSGTPEQVIDKVRTFGKAGLRHVVLFHWSPLISRRALLHAVWATAKIARSLRNGR